MKYINFEKVGRIAYIKICNEEKLNALNIQMMRELNNAVIDISKSSEIRVVILKGNDHFFSAGVDINVFNEISPKDAHNMLGSIWQSIKCLQIPAIAQVSGIALGGGFELTLMCDIIIADETAKFGFPEIKLGLFPGNGGCQRLYQLIGYYQAAYLLFSGETIPVQEIQSFISMLVPHNSLKSAVQNIATNISQKSLDSLKAIKRCLLEQENNILKSSLNTGVNEFRKILLSKNANIGIKAFLQKQTPKFE